MNITLLSDCRVSEISSQQGLGQVCAYPATAVQSDSTVVCIYRVGTSSHSYDSIVDAADFTVWQDNGGDQIDYRTWKDNFGLSIASGSGADHVPEPTTLLLVLLALVAAPLRVRCG